MSCDEDEKFDVFVELYFELLKKYFKGEGRRYNTWRNEKCNKATAVQRLALSKLITSIS